MYYDDGNIIRFADYQKIDKRRKMKLSMLSASQDVTRDRTEFHCSPPLISLLCCRKSGSSQRDKKRKWKECKLWLCCTIRMIYSGDAMSEIFVRSSRGFQSGGPTATGELSGRKKHHKELTVETQERLQEQRAQSSRQETFSARCIFIRVKQYRDSILLNNLLWLGPRQGEQFKTINNKHANSQCHRILQKKHFRFPRHSKSSWNKVCGNPSWRHLVPWHKTCQ